MNSNFNRQFILFDFVLVDDPHFIAFMNTAEFGTYVVLRRYIWRGGELKPHFLGLQQLYEEEKLLVSALSREKLAAKLRLKDVTRVSKQLTKLEGLGVVRRIRTGRESIYVLGEWVDYSEDHDSTKRLEWFYLDQKFGSKQPHTSPTETVRRPQTPDVAQKATSDVTQNAPRTWPKTPPQTWRKKPNPTMNNREENIKTVNGVWYHLENLDQPAAKTDYVAQAILDQLGDEHSQRFYHLVAAKVPESVIRRTLAEIKADGARHPERVFTYRMNLHALHQQKGIAQK